MENTRFVCVNKKKEANEIPMSLLLENSCGSNNCSMCFNCSRIVYPMFREVKIGRITCNNRKYKLCM